MKTSMRCGGPKCAEYIQVLFMSLSLFTDSSKLITTCAILLGWNEFWNYLERNSFRLLHFNWTLKGLREAYSNTKIQLYQISGIGINNRKCIQGESERESTILNYCCSWASEKKQNRSPYSFCWVQHHHFNTRTLPPSLSLSESEGERR